MTVILPLSGQPVAWLISDRESTEVMELFLAALKQQSPKTEVKVLMTDDGNARYNMTNNLTNYHFVVLLLNNTGWNAAMKVFGGELRHILCLWHVNQ